jgi:aerobic C4-dicarboxylate transport protein
MKTLAPARTPRKSYLRQLWVQVLIAMAVGTILGVLNPEFGGRMQIFGDAFIKAIRMLIAPIIFCTVVHGVARMADMARVGRTALKALVYFEVLTTIALIVGLVMVNLLRPGVGMNVDLSHVDASAVQSYVQSYVTSAQAQTPVTFLMNVIPQTFVGAFAEGNVLQVLVISVLFGFALIALGPRGRPLFDFIEAASTMLFGAVAIVMYFAPLGAFGAIAFTVGKFGAGSLVALGKLLAVFYLTCLVFIFGVLGPVCSWCGFRLLALLRYLREELLIVLATTSSETVLPRLIDKLENLGCSEGVTGLVVPMGYSFNLDGTCLYLAAAAVFLAQATNTPLPLVQQVGLLAVLLLTSKGAAGLAGAAFVVLAATLSTAGTIPVASVALILGIHRLMSEGLTPTNLIGNAVATLVISKWEGALDEAQLHRVLNGASATPEPERAPHLERTPRGVGSEHT